MTHLTWTIERTPGVCPTCESKTLLICAGWDWEVDSEAATEAGYDDRFSDGANIREEVTGHWCPNCGKMTSLSLNT